jgi:hypothetical protein
LPQLEAAEELDEDADKDIGIGVTLERLQVDERAGAPVEIVLGDGLPKETGLARSAAPEYQVWPPAHRGAESAVSRLDESNCQELWMRQ